MIPVQGYEGQRVAVLGLGRSGRASAVALKAGGAVPVVWDDGQAARDAAHDAGFDVLDLTKAGAFEGVAALIVSPGIPHLYPSPHPVIAAAWDAGVPVGLSLPGILAGVCWILSLPMMARLWCWSCLRIRPIWPVV